MPRSAAAEFAHLYRLPPAEALDYLKGRGLITETWSWQDLWQEEHARQFTVSRLARLDILKTMQDNITASVAGDLTRRDWMRDMQTLLKREGWWGIKEITDPQTGEILTTKFDAARLKLIFDTNTRMAYAAGHWQQAWAARESHPYLRYITKRDERVRAAHQAWDNLTLPIEHPFWKTHFPPNGYRCRCRTTSVSRDEYDRLKAGGRIKTDPPPVIERDFVNKRTGEITRVPLGVDPGFAYNPGVTAAQQTQALVAEKLAAAPTALADAARRGSLTSGGLPESFTGQRPGLSDLPPLLVVELPESGLTHAALLAQAKAAIEAIRKSPIPLVNDDSGWVLTPNRKSYKKIADNTDQNRASLEAVQALENLARSAVVAESHPDTEHGNRHVSAVYRLYVPLAIGGLIYRVKLTVKDLRQGLDERKLLHALEAVEIENAPLGTLPTAPRTGVRTGQPTTGRTISVADLLKGVKLHDGSWFIFGKK